MKRTNQLVLLFSLLLTLAFACKKKSPVEDVHFEKATLLANLTDNLILPNYTNLKISIQDLKANWVTFKANPNSTALLDVQDQWLLANICFQKAKMFHFGPALDNGLRAALGTFPTDTAKVLSNTTTAGVNLFTVANMDAIGFPALEFLWFRNNALTELNNSVEARNYVDALLLKMESEIQTVLNAWNNGYASSFKASTGTESTSGFSLLVNVFNLEYELAKNAKLGIPIGKQSLGIAQPKYAEAVYSGQSLRLLKENIIAVQNVFLGLGLSGTNGIGFDDYLVALDKQALHNEIQSEFTLILNDFNGLSSNLVLEIQNQPSQLDALYTKMHNLVVHLKTDMTSAFGVLITYQDNDGD